jgi:hypothetical protein
MGEAKNIVLRPITSAQANEAIKRLHYSGKVVRNSQFHIGVFYNGRLEGALQFGPSLDKKKILGLVSGTRWTGFLELNRMAFSEALPRNSESRALGIAMRLLRKHAPHIEWVVSFADAVQCGDGTIYRASGFVLTGISSSRNLGQLPNGTVIHKMTLESNPTSPRAELLGRSYFDITGGRYDFRRYLSHVGGSVLRGYQLRYVYFLNPQARERLTVPEIAFEKIGEIGAGMYRGKKRAESIGSDAMSFQDIEGGAHPTSALHLASIAMAEVGA